MSKKKWTREACYEEAKKYKTRSEFHKMNSAAYNAAWENGWLDDYYWFVDGRKLAGKNKTKYTEEKCREIALQCKTLKEFRTKYPSAYYRARVMGWIKDYYWLERQASIDERKTDNVYAYLFTEFNSVYIGRSVDASITNRRSHHRTDKGSTVYKFSHKNNIPIPEMTVLESGLTLEEGLEREDYYVNKYREEGWTVLNKAKTGKKSGSLGSMGRGRLTKEKCYELSLLCKTRGEFAEKYPSAYQKARKMGDL